MSRVIGASACLIALITVAVTGQQPGVRYTGAVSALRVPAAALGPEWESREGLVVDSFKDISKFTGQVRETVEMLQGMVPKTVHAVGDFTYMKRSNAFAQVTVRIFVFDSEQSCRDWFKTRYQSAGWEKQYTRVAGVAYDAVDSTSSPKRFICFGNVWMTSGVTEGSGEHLKALNLYLEKIRAGTQSK